MNSTEIMKLMRMAFNLGASEAEKSAAEIGEGRTAPILLKRLTGRGETVRVGQLKYIRMSYVAGRESVQYDRKFTTTERIKLNEGI